MGTSNSSQGYGYTHTESIFTQLWFWMIVIGIILLIIAAIDYAARREARWWTWTLLGIGAGMVILGIILGALYANRKPTYPVYAPPPGCAPKPVYAPQPSCGPPPQHVVIPQPPQQYTVPSPPKHVLVQPGTPATATQFTIPGEQYQPVAAQVQPTYAGTPQVLATPGATVRTPVSRAPAPYSPHTVVATSSEAPVRVG